MSKWNAQDYCQHSSEQQKWARELIAKLALRGDERVLDIGCGDGKVTAEIAREVPRGSVVGIDSSDDMIRFASVNFPPGSYPNLGFRLLDASHLDFGAEFDVAFSNACLHWIWDHRPVLRGIAEALKPGGKALLQMGGAGNAGDILAIIDDLKDAEPWGAYLRGVTFRYGFHHPDDYRRWLRDAGLEPVRVELIAKDMVHPGPVGLAGWIRTTWHPYTQAIPESLRQSFIDEIVRRYLLGHPLDSRGDVHLRMVRLEVEALKPG
ncbi:MAG: class I SAM-dependent methyltransferase [Bacillota bacterium]